MGDRHVKMMKVLLLVSSVLSLVVLASAAFRENFLGDWRTAQQTYKKLLTDSAGSDAARHAAASFAIEPKQLFLEELGTIDRCTTCHLGIENPAMTDAEQPWRKHPGDVLGFHGPDKFGCTVCHQGQGRATDKNAAHGWNEDGSAMRFVDTPMLRGEAVYTSCGRCHSEIDLFGGHTDQFAGGGKGDVGGRSITEDALRRSLPGAESLAEGKRLTAELGCLGCHKYRGLGGSLGPDLTYVGDKEKHGFDFSRITGEHTVEQWLFEHFKVPREVSLGTVMPDMGLSDREARSLALFMMGLHRKSAPASLTPLPAQLTSEDRAVSGETLYGMFCSACHGREGFGTTMRAGLWPADSDPWGHHWEARDVVVERRNDIDVVVPSLNHADTLAVASDDYLRRIIANGRPGTKMLGWAIEGALSGDDIDRLVRYIRGWNDPVADLASVASSRGDVHVGASLYRGHCASCHGVNGEGGIGNKLNVPTFLAVASDSFLRDTIVFGRPNTAMPSWRQFDAQALSDLLAFIRQWQPVRSDVASVLALCSGEDGTDVSAAIGRVLYKANCVMCHGSDGAGDLGPSLNTQAFLTVVPDKYLAHTLIEGRPGTGMPSWRHLSNQDTASIIRYLRTWQSQPSKPAAFYEQRVGRGDWDAGRYLFAGQCAGCHGSDGEGATGPQLSNPVFLGSASDVMLREWITYGKEGTEMRGFRKGGQGITELSDRQIEDLIAYLRLLQRSDELALVRVSKSPNGRPEKGAGLYAGNCAGCHGERGEGASGPALSNPGFLRLASDGFLMATMALGRSGTEMRPVKRGPQSILELSSDQINDLVAFLRLWEYESPFASAQGPIVPHRFVTPWDLARGRSLYVSNCAGCHGEDGTGSWAPELHNEGFLSAATDGFLQATIVRGRRGTAMRPFGRGSHGLTDLTSDDVDDLVAYIRHWSTQTPSPMTVPALRSLDRSSALVPHAGIQPERAGRPEDFEQHLADSATTRRNVTTAAAVPQRIGD